MKILFTVENYYPKTSGVPVVVQYLAEGLVKYGHDVHVATCYVESYAYSEMYNRVRIHRFNIKNNIWKKPYGDIKSYIEFVKNNGFDAIIVECAQCISTDILLPHLKKIESKKIFHSHGFSGMYLIPFKPMATLKTTIGNTYNFFHWRNYYKNILPKYLSVFDHILCLSKIDGDYQYFCDRISPSLVSILSNAADDMFFEKQKSHIIDKYADLQCNDYTLSVAYYRDVKNQMGILKEFYLSNAAKRLSMVFIGTERTPYYDKLLRLKSKLDKKYGWRQVYFLIGVERKDISGIMAGAKIYLAGSRREAFSISLIETMAVGTPFISTDVGNTSVLPGGLVISNIAEMHSKIDKLISCRELYEHLKRDGIKYTKENCRKSVIVDKLNQILQD